MDKVIDVTRSLGQTLQQDDRFLKYSILQQATEQDDKLQEMIKTFEGARADVMTEAQKGANKDEKKLADLNKNVQLLYNEIFENENMAAFTAAQKEMTELMNFINQIINGSFNGMDPLTIEQSENCGGACGSCSGC